MIPQPFGRYKLVEFLASGGMADVYRAICPGAAGMEKEVAIKLISVTLAQKAQVQEMFIAEGTLAAKLNHSGIVQVFDFDRVGDDFYIAMELVKGHSLRDVMDACKTQGVQIGLARSVRLCALVAEALAYAHRLTDKGHPLGIVHRDVSPQNVILSFEGDVKLSDFGIARAMNREGLTEPGTIKGKISYMAPEQARGEEVDARADIYALGVVLLELICGFQPFDKGSDVATLAAVMAPTLQIDPPSKWNSEVIPELDEAIMGALERDREKRTASCEYFAKQLTNASLKLTKSADDIAVRPLMELLWPGGGKAREVPRTVRLRSPAGLARTPAPAQKPAKPPKPVFKTLRRIDGLESTPESQSDAASQSPNLALDPPAHDLADSDWPAGSPSAGPLTPSPALRRQAPMEVSPTGRDSEQNAEIGRRNGVPVASRKWFLFSFGAGLLLATVLAIVVYVALRPTPSPKIEPGAQSAPPVVLQDKAPEPAKAEPPSRSKAAAPVAPTVEPTSGTDQPTAPPALAERGSPASDTAVPEEKLKLSANTKEDNLPGRGERRERTRLTAGQPTNRPAAMGRLRANPKPWAFLFIDGKRIGEAPTDLKLPAGRHRLRVERPGFMSFEEVVTITAGRETLWEPSIRRKDP